MIISAFLLSTLSFGTISGTVTISGKPAKNVAFWYESGQRPQPIRADVVQQGKMFRPHLLVIPVGSTVSFPNRDDLFHNVFAEYNAKKFDLGQYPKGQTRLVTFDKPGTVSVLCNIHSEMSAFILVVPTNNYVLTAADGSFSIKNVPSGAKLHYWHESGKSGSITASGGSVSLKL